MTDRPKAFPDTTTDIDPRLMLHVHPSEAEQAKQLGAHYDPENQSWFIHATQNPYNFTKWTHHLTAPQIRANAYYLAKAQNICPECRKPTPVFGIIVPPGTLFAVDEPSYPYDEQDYNELDEPAFLTAIEAVPPKTVDAMVIAAAKHGISILDTFHFDTTSEADKPYWLNHCENCSSPQLERELFHPEGLFCPSPSMSHEYISITEIQETVEMYASCSIGSDLQLDDMTAWDQPPSDTD